MRRILCVFTLLMSVLLFAFDGMAQDDKVLKMTEKEQQPFEQTVKKKKTVQKPENKKPEQQVVVPVTPKDEGIKVINPCPDEFKVELVSVQGNSYQQEVDFTVMITNLDVNRTIYAGNIRCFDTEGNVLTANSQRFEARTDIPVKLEFHLREKILPSKVRKFNSMVIKVSDCEVEFRDVPIDWK